MAMSIDTSTVFARFIGCLRWGDTREKVAYSGTLTPTRQNPYPWAWVRVLAGTGTGSAGIPQGYL